MEKQQTIKDAVKRAVRQENSQFASSLTTQAVHHAVQSKLCDTELMELADAVARWLVKCGCLSQAEQVFSSALSLKELIFGKDDPRVITDFERLIWFRSSIARTYRQNQAS